MLDIRLIKMQNPSSNLTLGSVITYTIAMINNSTLPINNAVLLDTIPICTSFVANSVTINGVSQVGANPNPPTGGVIVGNISAGTTSTLTFQAIFGTTPCGCFRISGKNHVENNSTLIYNYNLNTQFGSSFSNAVTIPLNCNVINPSVTKYVDKTSATAGDILTYTITIKNNDTITINNVNLIDTIPSCTSFVANSATINGVTVLGNPNPPSGLIVGSIGPGLTSTVTFKVAANTCPCTVINNSYITYINSIGSISSVQSNSITTNVICAPQVSLIKSFSPPAVTTGDIITYTCGITNNGSVTMSNINFIDDIPTCTTFIPDSLTENGQLKPGYSPNTPGITLGNISPGSMSTVTFNVRFIGCDCPNFTNTIKNTSKITYNYNLNQSIPISGTATSNTVSTPASCAKLQINKSANTTYVNPSKKITFNIGITNIGNTPANNVILFDTIPVCTTLDTTPCSIIVNGSCLSGVNPQTGIPLGTINPNQTTTISIRVIAVDNLCECLTRNNKTNVENNTTATYVYTIDPSLPNGKSGSANSNTAIVMPNCPTIPKLSFSDIVTLDTEPTTCIAYATKQIQVEHKSKLFSYKYLNSEGGCLFPPRELKRGDDLGFTLVFGNYGDVEYIAILGIPTVEDTLSIAAPMTLTLRSLCMCPNFRLLNKNSGNIVAPGDVFQGGIIYTLQVQKLVNGVYTPYFNLPCNSTHCISMLFGISFPNCPC